MCRDFKYYAHLWKKQAAERKEQEKLSAEMKEKLITETNLNYYIIEVT